MKSYEINKEYLRWMIQVARSFNKREFYAWAYSKPSEEIEDLLCAITMGSELN